MRACSNDFKPKNRSTSSRSSDAEHPTKSIICNKEFGVGPTFAQNVVGDKKMETNLQLCRLLIAVINPDHLPLTQMLVVQPWRWRLATMSRL